MDHHAHSHSKHQALVTHDDVHRAFRHVSELKVLAILALQPTVEELDAVVRRLGKPKRHKRDRGRSEVCDAIVGILAGDAER